MHIASIGRGLPQAALDVGTRLQRAAKQLITCLQAARRQMVGKENMSPESPQPRSEASRQPLAALQGRL